MFVHPLREVTFHILKPKWNEIKAGCIWNNKTDQTIVSNFISQDQSSASLLSILSSPNCSLTSLANVSSSKTLRPTPAIPLLVKIVSLWAESVPAASVNPGVWFAALSLIGIAYRP